MHPGEFVICADEKPSIQARLRIHETLPPRPARAANASSTPTSARGRSPTSQRSTSGDEVVAGRGCSAAPNREEGSSPSTGSSGRWITKELYAFARRVFWIVDNGSSHRGHETVQRLEWRWPNLVLVHLPVHASWLNQVEIYFSIAQRKVLEPNAFENVADVARTLNAFERHWNEVAEPFDWNSTRDDLAALMERLSTHEPQLRLAA